MTPHEFHESQNVARSLLPATETPRDIAEAMRRFADFVEQRKAHVSVCYLVADSMSPATYGLSVKSGLVNTVMQATILLFERYARQMRGAHIESHGLSTGRPQG